MKILKKTLACLGCAICIIILAAVGSFIGEAIYQYRLEKNYFSNLAEYESTGEQDESSLCPLCTQVSTNPPVIVNLNTGKAGEVRLYDFDRTHPNQVDATKTEYGCMMTGFAGGASYFSFPDNHYVDLSIQNNTVSLYSKREAEDHFCESCMALIESAVEKSCYLVADCYDEDNLVLYPLEDAQTDEGINIRHYNIVIDEINEYFVSLKMTSSYFDGGSELDYPLK